MSFFDEIKKELGISDMRMLGGFSYVNFCGETLYVEGVTKLQSISEDTVTALTKNAVLEVNGLLKVDDISSQTLVISGRIDSVTTRRLK